MIRVAQRYAAQNAHIHRTFAVLLVLFLTTAANADAWDEFQTRCLVPMESISLSVPTDLPLDGTQSSEEHGISAYTLDDAGGFLLIQDGEDVGGAFCLITGIELDDSPFEWARQAVDEGRYELLSKTTSHGPIILRSTDWREPKMEVIISWLATAEGQALSVHEADLEG